ncbi:hypothetical protein ABW21_db0207273 [Orbilia brochopaga]|nr:hypothetical protein ABW21_db0207273 [Drechslerella brochopaga]
MFFKSPLYSYILSALIVIQLSNALAIPPQAQNDVARQEGAGYHLLARGSYETPNPDLVDSQPNIKKTRPVSVITKTHYSFQLRPTVTRYIPVSAVSKTHHSFFQPTVTKFDTLTLSSATPSVSVRFSERTITKTDWNSMETFYLTKTIAHDHRIVFIDKSSTSSDPIYHKTYRSVITTRLPKTTLIIESIMSINGYWEELGSDLKPRSVEGPASDDGQVRTAITATGASAHTYTFPTAPPSGTSTSLTTQAAVVTPPLAPRATTQMLHRRSYRIISTGALVGLCILSFIVGTAFGFILPRIITKARDCVGR